jgi:hypothetical protein
VSLVHAEFLKISRRRLLPVMILVLGSLVGLGAFAFILLPQISDEVPVIVTKPDVYLLGAQQAAQTWFPIVLAAVFLGGEFSTTAWATALTRDSRKSLQINARLLNLTAASWLAFVLATAGWALLAAVAATGEGGLIAEEWLDVAWKLGAISLAWTSLGLAAVALFRSVGPAIGVGLALSIGEGFLALWPPYANVSLTAAGTGLFPVELGGPFGAFVPVGDQTVLEAMLVIVGWTILGVCLTWWGLQRRDA